MELQAQVLTSPPHPPLAVAAIVKAANHLI